MKRVWQIVSTWLGRIVSVPLALVLLFEEWGWRPLAAALAALARLRLVARIEAMIAALPPYPALAVFALPGALLFPVKLAGLYLLAQGKVLLAGLVIAAAKVVSTAIVARLFQLTQPALMQLLWFARAYGWFVPWKDAIFARIRASWAWRYGRVAKARVRQWGRRAWLPWRPGVVSALDRFREALRRSVARWRVVILRWRRRLDWRHRINDGSPDAS